MNVSQFIGRVWRKLKSPLDEVRFRAMTAQYDFGGHKRIYHVHIRKTGGTSLNQSFLKISGEDSASLYARLAQIHRVISDDKVYVAWNVRYINQGNYFYAFSHVPLHALKLPEGTFTVTCFRDPVRRVISLYNMLMDYQVNKIAHPGMSVQGKWLGSSFDDFLRNIPKEELCNQLYMFSAQYDIEEALERVQGLSHYMFTEDFAQGVEKLNEKTGLNLGTIHIRKTEYKAEIHQRSLDALKEQVNVEYEFLHRVRGMQPDE